MIDADESSQRQRIEIAGQIHDQIIPPLFAARMLLESIEARLSTDSTQPLDRAETIGSISQSRQWVVQAMMAARQVLSGVMPPSTGSQYWQQQIGLTSELLRLAPGDDGKATRLVVSGDFFWDELSVAVAVTITDIVTEAIRNAARHSRASRIDVLMRSAPHRQIEVVDNGDGFDTESVRSNHGIELMRSRAVAIGARLQIDSQPGGPTRVVLEIS